MEKSELPPVSPHVGVKIVEDKMGTRVVTYRGASGGVMILDEDEGKKENVSSTSERQDTPRPRVVTVAPTIRRRPTTANGLARNG